MNDTGSPPAPVLPGSTGTAVPALLERALIVALALFLVEQVLFPLRSAAASVAGPAEYARFVALCLALAAVSALPLALFVKAFHVLAARFGRSSWLARPAHGRWLTVLLLLVLGALMSVCQDGRFLRPAAPWATALFLLPGVLVALATHVAARRADGARYNAAAACAVVLVGWYFAQYEALDRFLSAMYGLSDEALLRTLIDLGIATSLVLVSAFAVWPAAGPLPRGVRLALLLAAGCALAVLHWADATLFVDLHLPVHTCLLMAAALVAWHGVSLLADPAARAALRPRARRLAALAPVLGIAATLALAPRSNAAYLAAQHTAFARFGMELVFEYGAQLDARVADAIGIAARAAHVLRKKPMPESPLPLPSTFARPVVDPAARTSASGAVIFFLDMKRARDIGPDADTQTPRIDRCFERGFSFSRAFSSSTRTLSVFGSIYSSTYAGTRGQTRPDLALTPRWFDYQNGHHNLVDAFRGAGFHTAALTNEYYLRYLRDPAERPVFGTLDRIVEAHEAKGQNEGLLSALAASPDLIPRTGRFLLIVHIMSHSLDQLAGVDAVVGEVCDALERAGRYRDTARMLTADHGVQYGEHGRQTYGRTLYQEELHVPLLWWLPGLDGGVVQAPVSALDHVPTLLDLFQIPAPFALEGRSYARAFRGESLDPNRPIFFEVRRYQVPSVGVVQHGLKLIRWPRTGTRALFSLAEDPAELRNLVDDRRYRDQLGRLDGLLTRFVGERH